MGGRVVGQKRPLTRDQVNRLSQMLGERQEWRKSEPEGFATIHSLTLDPEESGTATLQTAFLDLESLTRLARTSRQSCALTKATIADLDPDAIEDFRNRWIRKTGNQALGGVSHEQLLVDAELIYPEGSPISELCQVLPQLSQSTVLRLLYRNSFAWLIATSVAQPDHA